MGTHTGHVLRYVGATIPADQPLLDVGTLERDAQGNPWYTSTFVRDARPSSTLCGTLPARRPLPCGRPLRRVCGAAREGGVEGGGRLRRRGRRTHGAGGEWTVVEQMTAAGHSVARPPGACSTLRPPLARGGVSASIAPRLAVLRFFGGALPVDGRVPGIARGLSGWSVPPCELCL